VPSEPILTYLSDMKEALEVALAYGYVMAKDTGKIPSPIELRRKVRPCFNARYDYARHHLNPGCRTAVALLRSYRKKHKHLAMPEVKRLAMRIDGELFRLQTNNDGKTSARITLQPFTYEIINLAPNHKKWREYSKGRPSELLITDRKVCITFVIDEAKEKPVGSKLIAQDLNFATVDSTTASKGDEGMRLEGVTTESIRRIAQIQNDFSRRRRRIQLHVKNPQKRERKLRETTGRQRNRIKDGLHKLSSRQVKENPDTTFIFEKLTGIRARSNDAGKSKKFRTYLNRWPYRMYQSMVEYKSPNRTLYLLPGGTSSKCPVCGDKLKHPAWKMSRCAKCGVDYDRNRLASLAILLRGLRLCGQPFAVSADASWQHARNEYLYPPNQPEVGRAGSTDAANAPNLNVYTKIHV